MVVVEVVAGVADGVTFEATLEDVVMIAVFVAIEAESGCADSEGDGVKATDSACALCGNRLQTAVVAVEVVLVLIDTVVATEDALMEVFEACADLQDLFRLKTSALLAEAVAACRVEAGTCVDVGADAETAG